MRQITIKVDEDVYKEIRSRVALSMMMGEFDADDPVEAFAGVIIGAMEKKQKEITIQRAKEAKK